MMRDRVREKLDESKGEEVAGGSGENRIEMTDHQAIEKYLIGENESMRRKMDEKRAAVGSNMNRAEYDDVTKSIMVTKFAGKVIRNMGRTVGGKRQLYPEEAMFLMESAALELTHNGIPISLTQAYSLFITADADHDSPDDGLSCDRYVAYCHLMRAGYTLVRYRPSTDQSPSTSEQPKIYRSPDQPKPEHPPDQPKIDRRRLTIDYDVHLTESGLNIFKGRPRPNHRIVIARADDEAITIDQLRRLRSQIPVDERDVPLHAAVVDQATVIFLDLDYVTMPEISNQ